MKVLKRSIFKLFLNHLKPNKVLILIGPRRVGKTRFLKQIIQQLKEDYLYLNGEDLETGELLARRTVNNYKRLLNDKKILIIDEAQKIPDIGNILKLMVDEIEGIKIIASGSSAFELNNQLGEPLTGRKSTFYLYPFAHMEYKQIESLTETRANLEDKLIYGCYPELIHLNSNIEKERYLNDLVQSYLLKDILALDNIRNSSKLHDILRLIAFQIGKEVSIEEIGKQLAMSKNTVERYLDLLSKSFVIYKLGGYSRNLRSEVNKKSKWYFYDNGIRNAIIANFNPVHLRGPEVGDLWENYVLSERLKFQEYTQVHSNNFFWRNYNKQEIDWVEERSGKLFAYECKWETNKKVKAPSLFMETYPDSEFTVINKENYLDWIDPL